MHVIRQQRMGGALLVPGAAGAVLHRHMSIAAPASFLRCSSVLRRCNCVHAGSPSSSSSRKDSHQRSLQRSCCPSSPSPFWQQKPVLSLRSKTWCAAESENGAAIQLMAAAGGEHQEAVQEARQEEARQDRKWARAIVVENRAESADGALRTLVLSVEDHVVFLEGRKVRRRQEGPRWIDAYKVPGQFVGVRCLADPQQEEHKAGSSSGKLFAIASSPYNARRDSANLDASIIELLVDRRGCEDNRRLAGLGPGALLEVSEVLGRGFASLFNSYVGLLSGLEEMRNLLLVGAGRGVAPLRATIEWTPVQAHATAHRIAFVYVAPSALSAAYLKDWDSWREAGVDVRTVYLNDDDGGSSDVWTAVERAVFGGPHGLCGAVVGDPRNCTVLVSGLPGEAAAALAKRLSAEGVAGERVVFCDFF